jgi:1,4-alpha-glucan branching enzyme
MIRLVTLATADSGYLNFMGNEFGHPDWIDFPRQGNNWSFQYARRQWHLADDPNLKYQFLARFDCRMIAQFNRYDLLSGGEPGLLWNHDGDKVLAFSRGGWVFAFNFHPSQSFFDYGIPAPGGSYRMELDSDSSDFGGHGRLMRDQVHHTLEEKSSPWGFRLSLYLPSRTGIVLKPLVEKKEES